MEQHKNNKKIKSENQEGIKTLKKFIKKKEKQNEVLERMLKDLKQPKK